MNIAKHMEAIFLATAAFSLFTSYAQADTTPLRQAKARTVVISEVQTVTVTAKRLTAAEKAALAD